MSVPSARSPLVNKSHTICELDPDVVSPQISWFGVHFSPFFGRPPRRPLIREALDLAGDLMLPKATAAGFLGLDLLICQEDNPAIGVWQGVFTKLREQPVPVLVQEGHQPLAGDVGRLGDLFERCRGGEVVAGGEQTDTGTEEQRE